MEGRELEQTKLEGKDHQPSVRAMFDKLEREREARTEVHNSYLGYLRLVACHLEICTYLGDLHLPLPKIPCRLDFRQGQLYRARVG